MVQKIKEGCDIRVRHLLNVVPLYMELYETNYD